MQRHSVQAADLQELSCVAAGAVVRSSERTVCDAAFDVELKDEENRPPRSNSSHQAVAIGPGHTSPTFTCGWLFLSSSRSESTRPLIAHLLAAYGSPCGTPRNAATDDVTTICEVSGCALRAGSACLNHRAWRPRVLTRKMASNRSMSKASRAWRPPPIPAFRKIADGAAPSKWSSAALHWRETTSASDGVARVVQHPRFGPGGRFEQRVQRKRARLLPRHEDLGKWRVMSFEERRNDGQAHAARTASDDGATLPLRAAQHLAEARRSVSSLETSKFNQSDRLLFLPALRPAPPLPFKHKYRVHAPG